MFLGLPVATWGIGFYVAMLVLSVAGLQERFASSQRLSLAMLLLSGRYPIAPLAAKGCEQLAAVQNRLALSVEALARLGADDLHPMNSVLQAEVGQVFHGLKRDLQLSENKASLSQNGRRLLKLLRRQ